MKLFKIIGIKYFIFDWVIFGYLGETLLFPQLICEFFTFLSVLKKVCIFLLILTHFFSMKLKKPKLNFEWHLPHLLYE